jgi:aminopeptidase N
MSTYLVAYVISEFKTIKKKSKKYNIEVEVAARLEAVENGDCDYALEQSTKIIDYFSDYFGINYPISKSSKK